MAQKKKAAIMAHTKKAAKMAHNIKASKIAKYKKHKKSPLDSTPWEELSKNIKGKFKSKLETQDDHQNQLLVSEDCVNDRNNNKLNNLKTKDGQLKEVSLKDINESKHKIKKLKIEQETSTKNIKTDTKVEHAHESNQSDIAIKLEGNNDCGSSDANAPEFLPRKQLSKHAMKILKKKGKSFSGFAERKRKKKSKIEQGTRLSGLCSPISTEKPDALVQSETKKLPNKKRLEKRKLYEKKRLERRKELGIMLLPKNVENRLLRIRKALRKKNLPPEEVKNIMRKERSKAQDECRKSHATQICFNCRKPGHLVANCPSNEDSTAVTFCLKCGSTEHKYPQCRKKISGFPFATCFICKGHGHISRDCPDNEHGIYPKGGKCNLCDSIKHLKKDCPTLKIKKEGSSVALYTIDNGTSIDDEVMDIEKLTRKVKLEKPKVVTF